MSTVLVKVKQFWKRMNRTVEETSETNGASMEGWLYKRGEVKTNWTRRWCTLHRDEMKYYKKKDSFNPQGEILVEQIVEVKSGRAGGLTEMNGEENDNGFVLTTSDRTFFFMADSNVDKFEWIQSIGDELIRRKMEGPQG
mmetsp:Transcript_90244/g.145940  ORF Transcript_90244/g.145940 Transcript_90244/m.145940 type:complete len:140 (+) Transcript_90244:148-567(+)